MYQVSLDKVLEMLEDDSSLGTLKNQYTAQEIFDKLEDPGAIRSDEQLYEALLDVMYATRPVGHL